MNKFKCALCCVEVDIGGSLQLGEHRICSRCLNDANFVNRAIKIGILEVSPTEEPESYHCDDECGTCSYCHIDEHDCPDREDYDYDDEDDWWSNDPEQWSELDGPHLKSDPVNHPSHYNQNGIEVIDIIEKFQLGPHEGNVVKYVLRAKYKGKELEDLKKAQWYLNRKIANMEKELE